MSEDHKNLVTFYSGLAMLGLLMRSKGAVMADELTADAIAIGKSNPGPALGSQAGDNETVVFLFGHLKFEFEIAVLTLSLDS